MDAAAWLAQARAAVEPYPWRRLAPESLVRRVLAAVDHAHEDDDRLVEAVASALDGVPWRGLTVGAVCRHLLQELDRQLVVERWLDLELAWLLEEGA